ncbi:MULTISPECIES: superoxide dismutase family protein [Luteimonas]|uniref:Superoxide dismutase n=1 Tax=Luteimonas chenhongjianii TaxID=2006110 RepID=A0A290XBW0_9GAMM|nr:MULTISPECIES: superoxide dismutase family protein [Luteimonas]ATD66589.1 superoxide dismutase [Luteimonas chenhongjianii]RPD85179.1 superoxide dismutase family protein [Luteimonas sp. 100069]
MNRLSRLQILATTAAGVLAGCASAPRPAQPPAPAAPATIAATGTAQGAIANLASASGSLVSGRLVLSPDAGGVRVRGEIGGLVRNGTHNVRLHARGDCSAVDASSAGPEFDARAGAPSRQPDSGDRGRVIANANGVATLDLLLPGAVLGGGAANDIVGRSLLVLGATPGAISARVACGTVQPR